MKMRLISSKDLTPRIYMNGRKNLIQRSFNNLIDNGSIAYANKLSLITCQKKIIAFSDLLMMMVQVFQKVNIKMFLNHFIK